MEKVICRSPTVAAAGLLHEFAVIFAGYYGRIRGAIEIVQVSVTIHHGLEKFSVDVQMNWLLVVKEYIIRLCDVIAKIKQCIRIATPGRITEKHPGQRHVVSDPRPESMIVNFVNPDHV